MTPKENAERLAIKFATPSDIIKPNLRSICQAIVCVNEIISNSRMNYSGADISDNELLSDGIYWQEVLTELNNLKNG